MESIDSRYSRQAELVNSGIFDTPVTVIGAGGIGSFTTLALAKIGFKKISVWDYDTIEEHNISNQFYPVGMVGRKKVVALFEMIKMFEGIEIDYYIEKFTRDKVISIPGGVVVAAVDSMTGREEIFYGVYRNPGVVALVDGRMGGHQLEVYTCAIGSAKDKKRYKGTLWKDSQTANIPCTQKAVMYNVLTVSSWIVNQVRLVLEDKEYKRALIMDLENMLLVTPEEAVCAKEGGKG